MTRLIMVVGIVFGIVSTHAGGSVSTDVMQEATKWLLAIALINVAWGIRYGDMPKQDKKTARRVVTVGVLLKAALIAAVMVPALWLAGLNPWIAVGVSLMVAQIDPLTQTWLAKIKPSARTERILRVWATCDDPVTMAGLSVLAAVGAVFLIDFGVNNIDQNLASYIGGNIAVWLISVLMARTVIRRNLWTGPVVLVSLVAVAGIWGWFLGAALGSAVIGQKVADQAEGSFGQIAVWLDRLTKVVLVMTAILTGMLVAHWSLALTVLGVILGLAAYSSQMIVAPILCKEENSGDAPITRRDIKVMQLSHMNGVTALVIGLTIGQPLMASTAIVATWVAHGLMTRKLKV